MHVSYLVAIGSRAITHQISDGFVDVQFRSSFLGRHSLGQIGCALVGSWASVRPI
jgi:hypothetical protein